MDSTSKIKIGTLYDSVFRTMLNDCTQLIIPVVNEASNESYTGNEEIILEQNEIFLRQQDNISEKIAVSAAWQKYAGQFENIHSHNGRYCFIRCANAQSTRCIPLKRYLRRGCCFSYHSTFLRMRVDLVK